MASVPKPNDNGQSTSEFNFASRTTPPPAAAPDPFDPAALRLSQDFGATLGVKKVLTNVPVRKPNRAEFVRVRPGEEWRLETAALEDKINRETFLVDRSFWSEIPGEIFPVCLFLTISRQAVISLWPVKLPGTDGRSNPWNDSAIAAAKLAETRWVRMAANMAGGQYDIFEASGQLTEPTWPDLAFPDILRLAFKDRFIQSHDHPVLRALRGEV
jgi:hypothetical protein